MRSYDLLRVWVPRTIFAVGVLAGSWTSQPIVRADPPELRTRVAALGPPREGEESVLAQVSSALVVAETASAEGDSARAERHRDLAVALVRGLEARRRALELGARIEESRRALDSARAHLATAREAASRASADTTRLEAP